MGVEIERKFLVADDGWRAGADQGTTMRQGYLSTDPERTVRVRLASERAFLTIKGPTVDATRAEYEYEIPVADAAELLDNLCHRPLIEKVRYRVPFAEHTWEVDVFSGVNDGLIVAEVELNHPDEPVPIPGWIDREVTTDGKYANAALVTSPFSTW